MVSFAHSIIFGWLLTLFIPSTPADAGENDWGEELVGVIAILPHRVITNVDLEEYQRLSSSRSITKREALKELIRHELLLYHAVALPDVREREKLLIDQLVEQEIVRQHLDDAPSEYLPIIKKRLAEQIYERLQIEQWLQYVIDGDAYLSPAGVEDFYHHLVRTNQVPEVRDHFIIRQVVYPLGAGEEEESAEEILHTFMALRDLLADGSTTLEKGLMVVYRERYPAVRGKIRTHYLPSPRYDGAWSRDEMVASDAFSFEGWGDGQEGARVTRPHVSAEGGDGFVQLFYIEQVIAAHPADLKRDYPLLASLALANRRAVRLATWFAEHKGEVVIVDATYEKVMETLISCEIDIAQLGTTAGRTER